MSPPVLQPSATGERSRCRRHMLQPAERCCAAVPLAASDPFQASEAKAPLPESRGVCAALWTRIGSDVSEAVRLAAPSIPAAGRVRATGSQDSVDVRAAGFGSDSEQPRPTSALCLGLRQELVLSMAFAITNLEKLSTATQMYVLPCLSAGKGPGSLRWPMHGGEGSLGRGRLILSGTDQPWNPRRQSTSLPKNPKN
jgi:hypothetical protein